jgi:hypothetical protein
MKLIATLCLLFFMTGTSFAEDSPASSKLRNGKTVVAQSYCRACADTASACRLNCNGSGTCIQACDNAFRDCVDQNCPRRQ